MAEQIRDGAGSGSLAKVDSANRLNTYTITQEDDEYATRLGRSFNINSGLITLTSANESGVLYVKNNEIIPIHVSAIVAIFGPSTGGSSSDTIHVRFYKNPSTGTLISNATDAGTVSNRNYGSARTLNADAYKGTEGATITNGTIHIESLVSPGSRVFFSIDEVLQPSNSIAVSYEPSDGNTSMKCMAAIVCRLEDPHLD